MNRREAILKLIRGERFDSQAELAHRLVRMGFRIDQPRLSRELKAMGVVKEPEPDGRERYTAAEEVPAAAHDAYAKSLAARVREVFVPDGTVVLKTSPGEAEDVARVIRRLGIHGVQETLACADGVVVFLRAGADARRTLKEINAARARFGGGLRAGPVSASCVRWRGGLTHALLIYTIPPAPFEFARPDQFQSSSCGGLLAGAGTGTSALTLTAARNRLLRLPVRVRRQHAVVKYLVLPRPRHQRRRLLHQPRSVASDPHPTVPPARPLSSAEARRVRRASPRRPACPGASLKILSAYDHRRSRRP